jgi:hypothetical protein
MGWNRNYTVEMELGAMMYTPSYIKVGSGIQNLIGRIDIQTQTHRQEGNLIILLLFFKIWNVG